jgi:hypothetical protein
VNRASGPRWVLIATLVAASLVPPSFADTLAMPHDAATRPASDAPLSERAWVPIGMNDDWTTPAKQPGLTDRWVTPCHLAGWSPMPGSELALRISAANPHALSSLEVDVAAPSPALGWRLPLDGLPLGTLHALGVELLRDAASTAKDDVAPGVRLLVENQDAERCYLWWEPRCDGVEKFPTATWTRFDLVHARFRQIELGSDGKQQVVDAPLSLDEWLDGKQVVDKDGKPGIVIGRDTRVLAVEIVTPPLEGGSFRGAVDALTVGFSDWTLAFDFEDAERSVRLLAEDVAVPEGTRGLTVLEFPVRLSGPSCHPVTIGYRTYNGWASAPDDFVPAAGSRLLIAPDTLCTIPITIFADSTEEGDERFGIDVWMIAAGDTQRVSRIVTLLNDDEPPFVWMENATVVEGNDGPHMVEMHLRLSNPASSAIQVNLETRGGTALAGADYRFARGAVSFAPETMDAWYSVNVYGDSACETPEMLAVRFERIRANRVYQTGTGVLTIEDDDCRTPTLVSMLSAESTPEGIELRWHMSDGAPASVEIERAPRATGPWTPVALELREEHAVRIALDRAVAAGVEQWYRLRVRPASGEEIVLGPIAAYAAAGRHPGLGRIAPNPARGPVRVEFAVAHEAPVRMSIIDVTGREVARLAEGVHAPGSHLAIWNGEDAHGPAPAGSYFVQCDVDGKRWVRRLVIAR